MCQISLQRLLIPAQPIEQFSPKLAFALGLQFACCSESYDLLRQELIFLVGKVAGAAASSAQRSIRRSQAIQENPAHTENENRHVSQAFVVRLVWQMDAVRGQNIVAQFMTENGSI